MTPCSECTFKYQQRLIDNHELFQLSSTFQLQSHFSVWLLYTIYVNVVLVFTIMGKKKTALHYLCYSLYAIHDTLLEVIQ